MTVNKKDHSNRAKYKLYNKMKYPSFIIHSIAATHSKDYTFFKTLTAMIVVFRPFRSAFLIGLLIILALACKKPEKAQIKIVREAPATAATKAKEIRANTAAQVAEGLELTLWASDSLAPDPIAMSIDDEGRVYLTRTNRQKNSEFDIRGHRDWMIPSISLQSVDDRRAFLHKTFAPERSKDNEWLKDLNNDGVHDWHDLAVEQDEVWRLEDESGDGIADVATRILSDFNEEVTDVANGLLVRDEDVFVSIGPDMWRLKDNDGDGVLDEKKSISTGYAVHIGFSGHGMSGAVEGPDGKIYWGIGDIGAHITDLEGKKYNYANEGVIVRSNPDGSNFEIFASGLRNTHEFAFDEYGNIISSDNDGDHPGENERLVYIVEGSDAGWRANWQYGKYTDPKNNTYKVWMDERLYTPRWEGQAAYIIPPLAAFHNGPTGMVYNPGTALGSAWKNKFFLVEFVGNPSRSHIWAFSLKPKGAAFELAEEKDVLSGILPTGIKFGPDGALYIADWINGWGTKNYGRIWKLDVTNEKNDLAATRTETKKLMQLDYTEQSDEKLLDLLSYPDMRIRQKSQLELATRKKDGAEIFKQAIAQKGNQLARIHGIWGTGQLAAEDKNYGASLLSLLKDSDPEIIAQAAKVIGDIRYAEAGNDLVTLLSHENPRVKFFSAQALGRLAHKDAVAPLIKMIETNNDEDVYLRHAYVLALARIGLVDPVVALANNPVKALRTAAVLVLRRLKSEKISVFLQDEDEYIITEAARAINDDLSIEPALPALAAVLKNNKLSSEALLRRGINACVRVGGETELDILIAFAKRDDVSPVIRAEALAALGTWTDPSVLDRVDGRYRGKVRRDPAVVKVKVQPHVPSMLQSKDATVLVAASQMLSSLNMNEYNDRLVGILQQHSSPDVRVAIVTALHQLKYDQIENIVKRGLSDKDAAVRTVSISLLDDFDISKENLPGIVEPVFQKGTIKEQQQMLSVLGEIPADKSEPVLAGLINKLKDKKLSPALTLDLLEAVDSTHSENLISQASVFRSNEASGTAAFLETLYGGDGQRGGNYFFRNPTGQCIRCHTIGEYGGDVGPSLTKIGNVLTREQLLQALIEPSARISPGFGNVTVTLDDGQIISGILAEETESEMVIKTSEAEPMEIPLSRIKKRQNAMSSMPPMGTLMSKREIRDMVEFLAGLKKE